MATGLRGFFDDGPTHTLRGKGFDASEDGTGRGTPVIAIQERAGADTNCGPSGKGYRDDGVAFTLEARNKVQSVAFNATNYSNGAFEEEEEARSLTTSTDRTRAAPIVAFAENSRAELRLEGGDGSRTGALNTGGGKAGQGLPSVAGGSGVRRLTPRECERLQGFPDDYTLVDHRGKPAADGPRYEAIGNSMAVPVLRWIGERIQAVEAIP